MKRPKQNRFVLIAAFLALPCIATDDSCLWAVDAAKAKLEVSVLTSEELAPVISSFEPFAGVVGSLVTVHGLRFRNVTHVELNGMTCRDFTVQTDQRLVFEVPSAAQSGKLSVRADEDFSESQRPFTVISKPQIIDIIPDSAAPGDAVTLIGKGFLGVREIVLNEVLVSRFWIHSSQEIEAFVPFEGLSGPIELSGIAGSTLSSDSLTVLPPPDSMTFLPKEDSYVASDRINVTYGARPLLQVRGGEGKEQRALLKFKILGLWARPDSVRLQLYVSNSGNQGGVLYRVSNNYSVSATRWVENAVDWSNAPALTGSIVDSIGQIQEDEFVEFDVTDVVTQDGTYSFAIDGRSSDVVKYSSKEGEVAPRLVAIFRTSSQQDSTGKANEDEFTIPEFRTRPETLVLRPNYPNPFNAETIIEYGLPKASRVKVTVFNLLGQTVRVLVDQRQNPGFKRVAWNGLDKEGQSVSSAIFFVQVTTGNEHKVQKILLQK